MLEKRTTFFSDRSLRRFASTGFALVLAALVGWEMWRYYLLAPWTRDGRVRAETVNVATEVFGKITDIKVVEDQFVHKGDVLFVVDPTEFKLKLAKANATLESRRQDMLIRQALAKRRQHMSAESISKEDQQLAESSASVAAAAFEEAKAARDLAELDLERTIIRSPVNGYVDNLRLRVGDYAVSGQNKLTIIDSDSFWVTGYFEETKLPRIKVGDVTTIKLMGSNTRFTGHVESISRGIADANGKTDAQGLADVNPVFYWVRLAQRIPVRIHIDQLPQGLALSAGMTCTVIINSNRH
jgi:RND family efflux transporter MFP subunit